MSRNNSEGMVRRLDARDMALRTLLVLWALVIILPLIWVFYTSLKTNQEFFMGAWQLPKIRSGTTTTEPGRSLGSARASSKLSFSWQGQCS